MTKILHALGVCYVPARFFDFTEDNQSLYFTVHMSFAQVFVFGRDVFLTQSQLVIIDVLFTKQGQYISRDELLNVSGDKGTRGDRSINSAIKRLRAKLFPHNKSARRLLIKTKDGVDYRIPTRDQLKMTTC